MDKRITDIKLPEGVMNGWKHVKCYECPAAEYDEGRREYWCARLNSWCKPSDGCIASPIS